jgi:hypothetical protein
MTSEFGCFAMVSRSEAKSVLDAGIAGIPRVAESIAGISGELRERAFEAAERSYQQTVRDLGYSEEDAHGWISVVMFRLRGQVTELSGQRLNAAAPRPKQRIG